jgi:hypothetical protein
MLFGDKETFAVEIELIERIPIWKGFCQLWIAGKAIGDINSKEVLYPFINGLKHKRDNPPPIVDIRKIIDLHELYLLFTNYEIYCKRFDSIVVSPKSALYSFDKHSLTLSENFDGYLIIMFHFNNDYFFLWGEFNDRHKPGLEVKELFLEKVSCEYYDKVISEVEKYMIDIS